jgi:hypothetical protein
VVSNGEERVRRSVGRRMGDGNVESWQFDATGFRGWGAAKRLSGKGLWDRGGDSDGAER